MIRICKSLLREFYNQTEKPDPSKHDLEKPTQEYNQCGAWNDPDPILEAILDADGKFDGKFDVVTKKPKLIFPSGEFKNAEEFFADFDQAKIPFFDTFTIMAVEDQNEDASYIEGVECYSKSTALTNILPLVLAATALNFLA